MIAALFVLYVGVEVGVLAWALSTLGIVWTVCLYLAGSALGLLLVASQGRRALRGLGRAGRGEVSPVGSIADGALVAVGSVLMVVPGLVTSVLGLLLLIPPTRRLLRPAVLFVAGRRVGLAAAVADPVWAAATRRHATTRTVVIDGEVVDERFEDRFEARWGTEAKTPPQRRALP